MLEASDIPQFSAFFLKPADIILSVTQIYPPFVLPAFYIPRFLFISRVFIEKNDRKSELSLKNKLFLLDAFEMMSVKFIYVFMRSNTSAIARNFQIHEFPAK
jgi:hypothetical protein